MLSGIRALFLCAVTAAGCAPLRAVLYDPPDPAAGQEDSATPHLTSYLKERTAVRHDTSRAYRPYIAVFPFADESGFRKGIWELEHETARFLASGLDSIAVWRVVPYDAVIEAIGSRELTDEQLFAVSEKLMADIVVQGTLHDYNMERTEIGDPQLAGYKAYRGIVEMEVSARHAADGTTLSTQYSKQKVGTRGLGLDLFGRPRKQDEQFVRLGSMTFGSEEFLATALGEATAAAVAEIATRLAEELRPTSVTVEGGDPAQILSVHGDEVFINLGTENGLRRGYRFDVFAASEPGNSEPIAVVEVEDVIGARLSRVRVILASVNLDAGDRLVLILPE